MIHRPSVPDNNRYSQFFDDDGKIIAFIEGIPPFSNLNLEGSHNVEMKNHDGT